jgi:hypothetical protein
MEIFVGKCDSCDVRIISWNKKYNSCPATKLIVGCGSNSKKSSVWIVSDKKLVRHLGLPIYQAFYHLSVAEKSKICPSDFDERIVCQKIDKSLLDQAINQISQCRLCSHITGGYLEIWREIKVTLVTCLVIVNDFDWYLTQLKSCQLTRNSKNLITYLEESLRLIVNHGGKWACLASKMLDRLEWERCFFPMDLKIRICLGVDSLVKIRKSKFSLQDDSQWWEWALIVLALVILFMIFVFIFSWLIMKHLTEAWPPRSITRIYYIQ